MPSVVILLFILAGFLLKAHLVTRMPINQDEFLYLSAVHAYDRGEPMTTFQTFHVHVFGWLDAVTRNEVDQVVAGRYVMLLFFGGTCVCLFLLGRYFLGTSAALFSVLCYISLLFTIFHGASFRSDTIATFLSMMALYLFIVRYDSALASAAAGAAMALACLFTIKAGIYLALFPALSLIALYLSRCSVTIITRTIYFGLTFVAGFAAIYALHIATFPHAAPKGQAAFLSDIFSTLFLSGRLFPALKFLLLTLVSDSSVWLLLALGVILCLSDLLTKRPSPKERAAYLSIMSLPLLSLAVYRNAYPYYYAFLMPPATLFCGYAFHRALSVLKPARRRLPVIVVAVLVPCIFQNFLFRYPAPSTNVQHKLLAEIHKMFPEPVPYIDGCGMVSSFSNAGFFMDSASMMPYRERGVPFLKQSLADRKPAFLLVNVPHLDLHSAQPPESAVGLTLLEEDWTALRSYFIHHWGPVWVAGKQFHFQPGRLQEDFTIVSPGVYTVEADVDVQIDGKLSHPGDIVWLDTGTHSMESREPGGTTRLRWGNHLYCPKVEASGDPLFMGGLM